MKFALLLALVTLVGCKARPQDSAVQDKAGPALTTMQFPFSFAGAPGECVTLIDQHTVAVSSAIGFGQSWSSTLTITAPRSGETALSIDVPRTLVRNRVSDSLELSARLTNGGELLTVDAIVSTPEYSEPRSSRQFVLRSAGCSAFPFSGKTYAAPRYSTLAVTFAADDHTASVRFSNSCTMTAVYEKTPQALTFDFDGDGMVGRTNCKTSGASERMVMNVTPKTDGSSISAVWYVVSPDGDSHPEKNAEKVVMNLVTK